MRIEVNGESRDVPAGLDLRSLIEHLSLSQQRVAVELDRRVIRKNDWTNTLIEEGSRIEIVHFVGGG
jgi:thiamine biosynthesis protein ThiS